MGCAAYTKSQKNACLCVETVGDAPPKVAEPKKKASSSPVVELPIGDINNVDDDTKEGLESLFNMLKAPSDDEEGEKPEKGKSEEQIIKEAFQTDEPEETGAPQAGIDLGSANFADDVENDADYDESEPEYDGDDDEETEHEEL